MLMADRVVKVTLRAQIAEYQKGMREAAEATRTVGTEAEKLAQQKQAFEQLGRGAVVFGATVGAVVVGAVAKFTEFDAAMSNVQAATHETTENMELLRDAAIEAGARTVYSASEAAGAIEELSKAGISTADVLGGALDGSLDLAAAGGIAVADAAEIAASAMTQFGLEGRDVTHIADLIAAGAGKAQGGVEDLSQALNQSGLVASQMGLSLDETVGTLSMFASAGLMGSDAGTSFRNMLLRLANPTKEARGIMDDLGLSFYNSQGQFIGMEGVAQQLTAAMSDLSQEERNAALANLFGQDAIRAAAILYEGGASKVRDWTDAVDDSGYAAETAATRLDNLKGDWEALTGAVDSALISMGEAADGPLRFLVQFATDVVDGFNDMPEPAKQAAFWIGAIASAGSLALGTYLVMVPKIVEFNQALDYLGPKARAASRHIGTLVRVAGGLAILGAAAVGVDALANKIAEGLLPSAEQVENKMKSAASGVDLFNAALYKEGIENADQAEQLLGRLGKQLDAVADSNFWNPADISGTAWTVMKGIAETAAADLPAAQAQFRRLADDAGLTDRQIRTLIKTVPEFRDALTKHATAAGLSADAQTLLEIALGDSEPAIDDNTAALEEAAAAAEDAQAEIDGLISTIAGFGGVLLDSREAQRNFEKAVDDASEALKNNGKTLDINTEAGRANEAALDAIASAANIAASRILEQTGSEDDATAALQRGRDALIEKAEQFGMTADEAAAYADQVIADMDEVKRAVNDVPGSKGIHVYADTKGALQSVDDLVWAISQRRAVITVDQAPGYVVRPGQIGINYQGNLYDNGKVQAFASGGFPSGIYGGVYGGIHKFAESEMGVPWETYISGRAQDRDRNIGIWQETGRRLGVESGSAPMSESRVINLTQHITVPPGIDTEAVAEAVGRRQAFELRGY